MIRHHGNRRLIPVSSLALLGTLLFCSPIHAQQELMPYRAVLDTLQLSRVTDMAFNPEYGLLVADYRELMVWRITPEGRTDFIHAPGQGPGEYEMLNAVAWGPGGTIHIAGNTRVVTYSHLLEYESWIRQLRPLDIEVTEDGRVYVAVRGGGDGPVVMIDPVTDTQVAVTRWRDSREMTGIPDHSGASQALLQWNSETDLLYIGYTVDARFEVVRDSTVIHSFKVPSEAVEKSLSSMQRTNRARQENIIGIVSFSLFSFCFVEDGNLLVSLGGELILATAEGEVLQHTPWPPNLRHYYAAMDGYLFTVNSETMQIECVHLNDLFPE